MVGENEGLIALLKAAFPGLSLWVDNGVGDIETARRWLALQWGALVIGSELQSDLEILARCGMTLCRAVARLSRRGVPGSVGASRRSRPLAEARDRDDAGAGGSGAGPDFERLAALRAAAPDLELYAAGGVRDIRDIDILARAGVRGALVSTSLHDGRLGHREIERAHSLRAERGAGAPLGFEAGLLGEAQHVVATTSGVVGCPLTACAIHSLTARSRIWIRRRSKPDPARFHIDDTTGPGSNRRH